MRQRRGTQVGDVRSDDWAGMSVLVSEADIIPGPASRLFLTQSGLFGEKKMAAWIRWTAVPNTARGWRQAARLRLA